MENENPRVPPLWEHSLTTLLGNDPTSDPGIALRQWVHFQGLHNILDLLSWDQEELKAVPPQQVYSLGNHGQGLYLTTNQIKQMCGLITYVKHVFGAYNSDIDPRDDPFHPFTPDEWSQQTSTMLITFLIQNLPNPNRLEPVPSGPISSSRPTGYSPSAIQLMDFKKGIKREIAAYPSLKDERYFDGFKRSLLIVAKTYECNEVLDPTILQVVNLRNTSFLKPNKPLCAVSLMLTFKLTWGRRANTDAQLCINIECAFGQLVHQWPINHRPLSANCGVKKQTALVHALCSLHNFSKNQRYNNNDSMMQWEDVCFPIPDSNGGMILPPVTTTGTQIVSYDVTWRDEILDANDQFDNVEEAMSVMNRQRRNCIQTRLCDMVAEHNLR